MNYKKLIITLENLDVFDFFEDREKRKELLQTLEYALHLTKEKIKVFQTFIEFKDENKKIDFESKVFETELGAIRHLKKFHKKFCGCNDDMYICLSKNENVLEFRYKTIE